jgi:hypothetical protein
MGSSGAFMRERRITNRFAEEENIGELGNQAKSDVELLKKIRNKDSSSIPINQLSTIPRQDT